MDKNTYVLSQLQEGRPAEGALLRPGREIWVGRHPENDVFLPAPAIARRHLRVWHDGHVIRVRDWGSPIGFRVNGQRSRPEAVLRPGDLIELAGEQLGLEQAPTVAPEWLAWNEGTLRKLAEEVSQSRSPPEGTLNPVGLGILADALEDAGCVERRIIDHLRSGDHHVRACWAVALFRKRGGP